MRTPRTPANGMNHRPACLCLPSRSWYSFTDPWGMEGWVGLGREPKLSLKNCNTLSVYSINIGVSINKLLDHSFHSQTYSQHQWSSTVVHLSIHLRRTVPQQYLHSAQTQMFTPMHACYEWLKCTIRRAEMLRRFVTLRKTAPYRNSLTYIQVWAPDNGRIPLPSIVICNYLMWGNSISHKLEVEEPRYLASH